MDFAIEVPGEASPLDLQELCRALEGGSSRDTAQRQAATQQLATWETRAGFYPLLHAIFLDKSKATDLRQLAIILLKNGVDKYWRHGARNGLPDKDRDNIRRGLYQGCVEETDSTLLKLNALVVAKIVRLDWPDSWTSPLEDMVNMLKTYGALDPTRLHGAVVMLLAVVKEVSKARLRKHQTALLKVAPEILYTSRDVFNTIFREWMARLNAGAEPSHAMEIVMADTLNLLKIIRRVFVLAASEPTAKDVIVGVWVQTQHWFEALLGCIGQQISSTQPATPVQDIVSRHALQISKLYLQMSDDEAAAFVALPNSIAVAQLFWKFVLGFADRYETSVGLKKNASGHVASQRKPQGSLDETLALQGLLLLKNCVAVAWKPQHTFKFKTAEAREHELEAVATIKSQLLTDDLIMDMIKTIISKLLLFRGADLEAWETDPEEYELTERQFGNAWEFEVRPCAERILIDLLVHYKQLLHQPLADYFQTAAGEDSDIAVKEAVYTAMGAAAPNIYETFDFDTFLTTTIVQDARRVGPLAKVLRRRIAILLSSWVTVKIASTNLPLVFSIFRHLLDSTDEANDLVVRITAGRQLKLVVDDWNFPKHEFAAFASDIIGQLLDLLDNVNLDETKESLFETLSCCVARMEKEIAPFAQQVMAALPGQWVAAEDSGDRSYVTRQSVLTVLSSLITSLGSDASKYQDFYLPVVVQSVHPDTDDYIILQHEVLNLWKIILEQSAPPIHASLAGLIPNALDLVGQRSEVIEDAVEIVKAYVLLAPESMLSDSYRNLTIRGLGDALHQLERSQVLHIVKSMENLIRAAGELGGTDGMSVLVQDLLHCGLVRKMLENIHGAWESRQTTGPKAKTSPISSILEKDYFIILARIAFADNATFVSLLESLAPLDSIWPWLMEEWFGSFDAMADIERQKLSCLALTRLCELPQPVQNLCLGRLQDYFAMWTTVVAQLQDGGGQDVDVDPLVWTEAPPRLDTESAFDAQESVFATRDPVHTVHTFQYIQERLSSLVNRVGGEQAFQEQWTVNVDRDVLSGFQALSNPPGGSSC